MVKINNENKVILPIKDILKLCKIAYNEGYEDGYICLDKTFENSVGFEKISGILGIIERIKKAKEKEDEK